MFERKIYFADILYCVKDVLYYSWFSKDFKTNSAELIEYFTMFV